MKCYNIDWEKYQRKKPIKEFNLEQTMYSLVKNESKNDMNLYATGFMGSDMTYNQLIKSSDKLAQAFYQSGIREGDTVSILTVSYPVVQQCLLSLSKIGATMSWIDLRSKSKELIKSLNKSNSKMVVVFEDVLPLVESVINETDVKNVIVSSPKDYLTPLIKILVSIKDKKDGKQIVIPDDKRFITFNDFIRSENNTSNITPVSFEKERPSLIIQSSGSTGTAKQIIHTEYNFNSAVQKMAYADLPFYKGDTMHISIPPFIIYGLGNSIYASLAFTMKAEMNPYVSDNTVCDDLGKFDLAMAAPLHYRYIYNKLLEIEKTIDELSKNSSASSKKELSHLFKEYQRIINGLDKVKGLVSGGDKIDFEELIQLQQKFNKPIVNGYGNNECLGAVVVSPLFANRPGSIGIPMYGVDVKIVDPDTKELLPPNKVGELYVSSDSLFVKYLGNEEATLEIKTKDESGKEWVETGDLCLIDNDGYIFHKGRCKRLIKKEAFKICPDTIERVINSLSFVKECVVVGVDDEKSLSVPMAFIELMDPNQNFEEALIVIKQKCAEDLPDYEIPSYFEQIDKIPYKNNKQAFLELEELGNKIVQSKKCLVLKKLNKQ